MALKERTPQLPNCCPTLATHSRWGSSIVSLAVSTREKHASLPQRKEYVTLKDYSSERDCPRSFDNKNRRSSRISGSKRRRLIRPRNSNLSTKRSSSLKRRKSLGDLR